MARMNETLHIGEINTLIIDRMTAPGLFLRTLEGNDVLLPNQYVTETMHIGNTINVFVYTDSEDRPVATTLTPKGILNQLAFVEVIDTTDIGAFVNWGLPKDLFVPKIYQKRPFRIGEKRILRIVLDQKTNRLTGTEKISAALELPPQKFYPNTPVSFMIIAKTPMGYKAIVDHRYEGMLYANEIFESIRTGDIKHGFIKLHREDGKLDLSLQKTGRDKSSDASEKILSLLHENGGMLPCNYKSDPNIIQQMLGMSKKNFKAALTKLQENQKITIKESGIYGI